MATFTIKINQRSSELSVLPKGPLKDRFETFRLIIDNQLGALCCQTHNFKPAITLENNANQVRISGLDCCCQDFRSKTVELLKEAGIDTEDRTQATLEKEMIF